MAGRKRPEVASDHPSLGDELAQGIAEYRKKRRMTQEQLAAILTSLGIPSMTQRAVARIELRQRVVSFEEAVAFAVALEVPLPLLILDVAAADDEADGPKNVALTPTTVVSTWQAFLWWSAQELLPSHTNAWARGQLTAFEAFRRYTDARRALAASQWAVVSAEYTGDEAAERRARRSFVAALEQVKHELQQMETLGLDVEQLGSAAVIEEAEALMRKGQS